MQVTFKCNVWSAIQWVVWSMINVSQVHPVHNSSQAKWIQVQAEQQYSNYKKTWQRLDKNMVYN